MASKTNTYEAMFLMGTTHTSDVDGSIKLVRGLIEKYGGEILVCKRWDDRKLAYEIGKAKRGLFIITYFKLAAANVATMERDVRLSEDFLRVLVTRAEHLSLAEMEAVEPQPIAPPAPERAPWDQPEFSAGPGGDRPRGPRGPGGGGRRRDEAGASAEAAAGKDA